MPRTPEQFEQIREERRDSIIQTALQLFAEQGYDNTSIAQIAKEADISKGLIYNYFDSKEHLLKEVINEGYNYFPMVTKPLEEGVSPDEAFLQTLNGLRDSLKTHRTFWKFYAELLLQLFRNEELLQKFAADFEGFLTHFINLMQEMGVEDPEMEGRKLAAALDGVLLHSLFYESYPVDGIFDNIIKSYLPNHE